MGLWGYTVAGLGVSKGVGRICQEAERVLPRCSFGRERQCTDSAPTVERRNIDCRAAAMRQPYSRNATEVPLDATRLTE